MVKDIFDKCEAVPLSDNYVDEHDTRLEAECALLSSEDSPLHMAIDSLSMRQADVLRLYYLEGMTLERIGLEYDVTRERIRQIVKTGVRMLSHVSRSRKFESYCEALDLYVVRRDAGRNVIEYKTPRKKHKKAPARRRSYINYRIPYQIRRDGLRKLFSYTPLLNRYPFGLKPGYHPNLTYKRALEIWEESYRELNRYGLSDHPLRVFHGKCSCNRWHYTFRYPHKPWATICCDCKTVFFASPSRAPIVG